MIKRHGSESPLANPNPRGSTLRAVSGCGGLLQTIQCFVQLPHCLRVVRMACWWLDIYLLSQFTVEKGRLHIYLSDAPSFRHRLCQYGVNGSGSHGCLNTQGWYGGSNTSDRHQSSARHFYYKSLYSRGVTTSSTMQTHTS